MKLSTKIILPIILISALLILLNGCFGVPTDEEPGYTPGTITGIIASPCCSLSSDPADGETASPEYWCYWCQNTWDLQDGIEVVLTYGEDEVATTTTNEDGEFTFADVSPGKNYVITAYCPDFADNRPLVKDVALEIIEGGSFDTKITDLVSTSLGLVVDFLVNYTEMGPEDISLIEVIADKPNFPNFPKFKKLVYEVRRVLENCEVNMLTDDDLQDALCFASEEVGRVTFPDLVIGCVAGYTPPPPPPTPDPCDPNTAPVISKVEYDDGSGFVAVEPNDEIHVIVGQSYTIRVTATDDGTKDPLTYSGTVDGVPFGPNSSNQITVTPAEADEYSISLSVYDGCTTTPWGPVTVIVDPRTYHITFDKNDIDAVGTMADQIIASGSSANLTANAFSKEGWTFMGWAETPTGAVAYADQASYLMGTADVTLYAKWNAIGYHITFDKNDIDAVGTMADQIIASGSSANLTANAFSKEGWTFMGWAETPTGAVAYADQASYLMGTADVTLYAKWNAIGYHITFDKNDIDAVGTMADQIIASGSSANLTANAFSKEGWTFMGWAETPTGAVAYADQASYLMGTADVTLYAKWNANNYHITFDKNDIDAVGTMADQIIASGSSANLTANAFSKEGWTFMGWAETPTGAVAYADQASYLMGTADVTLYAKWNAIGYHITFDKNDIDAVGTMADQIIASGSSANLTANAFSKEGWTFMGWAETPTGAVAYADQASYLMGTADVTLYAKWNAIGYHITFDKNDIDAVGTMADQIIASGSSANLTANAFSKEGWTFMGWAETPTGAVAYADQASYLMGTADVTLYAKWNAIGYHITFDKNDIDAVGTMADQIIASGSSANLTANAFSKEGWTFMGWAETPTGAVAYADQASYLMGTADVTLYAKWNANNYHITFDKNDIDAVGTMADQIIASGSSANLTANAFSKEGWTFMGWAETPTGAVAYADQASYLMGTADVTLYAKWNAIGYHITFDKNDIDAVGTMADQIIASGSSANLTANAFSKEGWTFMGWAETPTGAVAYADQASYLMGTADVTLYAKWNAIGYHITFDKNDIDAVGTMADQIIASGSSANLTANAFSKEGWTFMGWAETPTGAVAYADQASYLMGTADVTLYAKWNANNYHITFDKNDIDAVGTMADQIIASGSSANLTANAFSKEGWTFMGWAETPTGAVAYADQASYLMGTADVTLYAKWNAIGYTLTINYMYEGDGQAADPHVETLNMGSLYSVDSPLIAEYTADRLNVSGIMPADDVTETVIYVLNPCCELDAKLTVNSIEWYKDPSDSIWKVKTDCKVVDNICGYWLTVEAELIDPSEVVVAVDANVSHGQKFTAKSTLSSGLGGGTAPAGYSVRISFYDRDELCEPYVQEFDVPYPSI